MTGVRNGVMNTLGPNLSRVVRAATAAIAVMGSGTGSGEDSRSENQTESISLFSQSSTNRQKKSRPAGPGGHGPGITPMRYLIAHAATLCATISADRLASRSTATPRRITAEMRRVLVMSSSGLASSTMKSALLPASSVPASASRRNSAELRVAATMTCIGVIPASTMSSISSCGPHGRLPSVPSVMRTPAAFSFARLRAWIP